MPQQHSTTIPCLRYQNAPAAIDALCSVLGFEKHLVVPGSDPSIVVHSQLRLGPSGGMIMVGSASLDSPWGRLIKQPSEIGGVETQSACLVVPDADEVFRRVQAASGWTVVMPIEDQNYGGRGFLCKDMEGHMWWVGTYDPWAPPAQ